MGLVIGFDLDLTLVDSADGITAALVEAGRQMGATVEPETLRPLLGLPLDVTVRHFVDESRVAEMMALYRELYPGIGVPATKTLPGAREAVESIHDHRGRVLVVSAKIASAVRAVLDHVELPVDHVVGEKFAETKGEVLREHGADVFVGDHPGDMIGARSAGAYAMGVTTGSHDGVALREAGADVVFSDLLDFPYWLADFVGTPT
ncbi:phosphoglycolate phosphatase [Haloactinopolyspora alba]|uniref:Phosphoglycolate phosphatase n=1 Tax=Haloactinopolyspora alba TaxID=648780 RepID=A0A2P8DM32_9ACTN|nr:HAD family hydrolase [Haloactinopolyspora alba]PSK98258.1 phosphoglycolate phosphatase [Haloactinopolyspora alba]